MHFNLWAKGEYPIPLRGPKKTLSFPSFTFFITFFLFLLFFIFISRAVCTNSPVADDPLANTTSPR